ncbi:MAG: radical SAM protein [Ruminococcaceae bacterium]|nr:radical SAM protein [Oscillospiraceae bacterium]
MAERKRGMTGLIADIQRASLHDGNGIRTTVFFKGCPLSCKWCHNPECIGTAPEELFYPDKCIGCGMCKDGCYSGARVICGQEMTAEDVLSEVKLDITYYTGGGGVTFSGGEPLMQQEFLREAIDLCKKAGIGCAVETSLLYFDEDIFKTLDFVMADLKIWNSGLHREYVGVSNEIIKENFKRLNTLGIPIIARTPVISEIDQGIPEISAFLKTLDNVIKYELLPYHPLGISKAQALGRDMTRFTTPRKETMEELNKYAFIR